MEKHDSCVQGSFWGNPAIHTLFARLESPGDIVCGVCVVLLWMGIFTYVPFTGLWFVVAFATFVLARASLFVAFEWFYVRTIADSTGLSRESAAVLARCNFRLPRNPMEWAALCAFAASWYGLYRANRAFRSNSRRESGRTRESMALARKRYHDKCVTIRTLGLVSVSLLGGQYGQDLERAAEVISKYVTTARNMQTLQDGIMGFVDDIFYSDDESDDECSVRQSGAREFLGLDFEDDYIRPPPPPAPLGFMECGECSRNRAWGFDPCDRHHLAYNANPNIAWTNINPQKRVFFRLLRPFVVAWWWIRDHLSCGQNTPEIRQPSILTHAGWTRDPALSDGDVLSSFTGWLKWSWNGLLSVVFIPPGVALLSATYHGGRKAVVDFLALFVNWPYAILAGVCQWFFYSIRHPRGRVWLLATVGAVGGAFYTYRRLRSSRREMPNKHKGPSAQQRQNMRIALRGIGSKHRAPPFYKAGESKRQDDWLDRYGMYLDYDGNVKFRTAQGPGTTGFYDQDDLNFLVKYGIVKGCLGLGDAERELYDNDLVDLGRGSDGLIWGSRYDNENRYTARNAISDRDKSVDVSDREKKLVSLQAEVSALKAAAVEKAKSLPDAKPKRKRNRKPKSTPPTSAKESLKVDSIPGHDPLLLRLESSSPDMRKANVVNVYPFANRLMAPRHAVDGYSSLVLYDVKGTAFPVDSALWVRSADPNMEDFVYTPVPPGFATGQNHFRYRAPVEGERATLFYINPAYAGKSQRMALVHTYGDVGKPISFKSITGAPITAYQYTGSSVDGSCGGVVISQNDNHVIGFWGLDGNRWSSSNHFWPVSPMWVAEWQTPLQNSAGYLASSVKRIPDTIYCIGDAKPTTKLESGAIALPTPSAPLEPPSDLKGLGGAEL